MAEWLQAGWTGVGRFLGRRAARSWHGETQSLVTEGIALGSELAKWKADSELLHLIQETVLPLAIAMVAILSTPQIMQVLHGGAEARRIAIGIQALIAFGYASYISILGAASAWRHLRGMFVAGLTPRAYLRMLLALGVQDWLAARQAALSPTIASALASFQQATDTRSETLAGRLADQIAARLWRHLAWRLGCVMAPMFVALIYYRAVLYPSFLGASTVSMILYPLAAAWDGITGQATRAALMAW